MRHTPRTGGIEQVDKDRAERWIRPYVLNWVPRAVLPGLWVLFLALSMVLEQDPQCTSADPGLCGPDETSPGLLVLALSVPLLLLWIPYAGCVLGTVLSVALCLDRENDAQMAVYAVQGLLCFLGAVWLHRSADAQRQEMTGTDDAGHTTDRSTQTLNSVPEEQPETQKALQEFRTGTWMSVQAGWNLLALGTAAALLAGSAGLWAWYESGAAAQEAHTARARTVTGQITEISEDRMILTVRVEDRTIEIASDYPEQYEKMDSVPILLDPNDPSWARLVAEPADLTHRLALALACLLLAGLILGQQLHRHRKLSVPLSGGSPAVLVQVIVKDFRALLFCVDGFENLSAGRHAAPRPFALIPLTSHTGRPPHWRSADPGPRPMVLTGDLRSGGWAVLVASGGPLLPAGPILAGHDVDVPWNLPALFIDRALSQGPWTSRLRPCPDAGPGTAGRAADSEWAEAEHPLFDDVVPAVLAVPEPDPQPQPQHDLPPEELSGEPGLPVLLGPVATRPAPYRAFIALITGGTLLTLLMTGPNLPHALAVVLGSSWLVFHTLADLRARILVTRDGLELNGPLLVRTVPWEQVHELRGGRGTVLIGWRSTSPLLPGWFELRFPGRRSSRDGTGRDEAERTAALLRSLCDRAVPDSGPRSAPDERPIRTGLAPGVFVLASHLSLATVAAVAGSVVG
ncbi:MAG: hypothetical protein QG608_567 [Actinomycetota bacterium]|nr:hypothetical protein [Actinomycetota bacterium]